MCFLIISACHQLFQRFKAAVWQVYAYRWLTSTGWPLSTDCNLRVGANAADEAERYPGQQQQQQQFWEAQRSTAQPEPSCNTSQRSVYVGTAHYGKSIISLYVVVLLFVCLFFLPRSSMSFTSVRILLEFKGEPSS